MECIRCGKDFDDESEWHDPEVNFNIYVCIGCTLKELKMIDGKTV